MFTLLVLAGVLVLGVGVVGVLHIVLALVHNYVFGLMTTMVPTLLLLLVGALFFIGKIVVL